MSVQTIRTPTLRQLRKEQRQRDKRNGWWQNESGDWFRDTPHATLMEKLFDRAAESYVNTHGSVERLEKELRRDIALYGDLDRERSGARRIETTADYFQGATGATGVGFPVVKAPTCPKCGEAVHTSDDHYVPSVGHLTDPDDAITPYWRCAA